MNHLISVLLPVPADNTIRGGRLPVYVFTVRSCIRLLTPDSGAGSIAGMDLSVALCTCR